MTSILSLREVMHSACNHFTSLFYHYGSYFTMLVYVLALINSSSIIVKPLFASELCKGISRCRASLKATMAVPCSLFSIYIISAMNRWTDFWKGFAKACFVLERWSTFFQGCMLHVYYSINRSHNWAKL